MAPAGHGEPDETVGAPPGDGSADTDPAEWGAQPKGSPEEFALRVQPQRVARINRRLLAVLVGGGLLAVLGIFSVALAPPPDRPEPAGLDVGIVTPPRIDAVERLPGTYGDIVFIDPAAAEPDDDDSSEDDPSPPPAARDPAEEAARAARRRDQERATEAMRSELFFPVQRSGGALPAAAGPVPVAAPVPGPDAGLTDTPDASDAQARKRAFLDARPSSDIYNPHPLEDPVSPWQVMAGTVLRAALITGLNSDLPGFVIAKLTEDVFDTVTGRVLLLPRGTRLLGRYDSRVAFGQERALVVWHRLILPNGASVVVENLPAADMAGQAGLSDSVDLHMWQLARGVLLSSLLGVGTELAWEDEDSITRAFRESVQKGADSAGSALIQRELDVQPTIRVRPGWPLAVLVHRDLVLRPWHATGGS